MTVPLQITFRNMESSEAVETRIREEVEKLQTYFDQIISCRVVVEIPHRHHQQGNTCLVTVDLHVPGSEIVVKQEPTLYNSLQHTGAPKTSKQVEISGPHKDMYTTIRDAFKGVRRKLQDFVHRQRHQVKQHEETPLATVSQLFVNEGYGFIETIEGELVYFHRNSLNNGDFEALAVGTPVSFIEELGEKGPQASLVKVIA